MLFTPGELNPNKAGALWGGGSWLDGSAGTLMGKSSDGRSKEVM